MPIFSPRFVQAVRVAPRAVAVKLFPPFHHIAVAAVFRNQLVHLIATLARAFPAFDAQHIELAFDIAEYEVGSMARAYSITSSARASSVGGTARPSEVSPPSGRTGRSDQ